MHKLGLLGKNIAHSKSQHMYEKILNSPVDYCLFDYLKEEEIPSLDFFFSKVDGLSITSPYKEFFLNDVVFESNIIKNISGINCIKKVNGNYLATNTDYLALKNSCQKFSFDENCHIALLGNGVMSRVAKSAFAEFNLNVESFTRAKNGDLSSFDFSNTGRGKKLVIVNACSRSFFFRGKIPDQSTYWDFNYSIKDQEEFIKMSNGVYIDGLELLEDQAREAVKFWNIESIFSP